MGKIITTASGKTYEQKHCLVCEEPLIKKTYESIKRYSKKQFCSTKHGQQHMKENSIGWYSSPSKQR